MGSEKVPAFKVGDRVTTLQTERLLRTLGDVLAYQNVLMLELAEFELKLKKDAQGEAYDGATKDTLRYRLDNDIIKVVNRLQEKLGVRQEEAVLYRTPSGELELMVSNTGEVVDISKQVSVYEERYSEVKLPAKILVSIWVDGLSAPVCKID